MGQLGMEFGAPPGPPTRAKRKVVRAELSHPPHIPRGYAPLPTPQ